MQSPIEPMATDDGEVIFDRVLALIAAVLVLSIAVAQAARWVSA